ncbi:DNA-binding transcriptional regulator, GntR family [Bosea sp. CRIB-10]|uniref:GntR family transcriptional regulator n=1 Tax=Bosea sp. CRIB-10 TaxID=378404 RepID=UPI0008EDB47C|nr:GntR family transcriptional regulator [Bosea sp. CRIB-10]SFD69149.1 DNA-binding transcriptional regulator, GntR family [Bosea sp. CRIB-10]
MTAPTRLQQEIAERILRMVREDGLEAGAWLNENSAARRLNVSRTPVRAAIDHLARQGLVRRHPNKGVELLSAPEASADPGAGADATELAMVKVAQDRHGGRLPDEISELELMRRYELGRPEVQRLMARLADLDMVERKRGYGWRFLHEPRDQSAHDERYRFRQLIEPMVFLEPGFSLDQGWIDEMRTRHELTLSQPWKESSAIGFYEMNADFHEGLAAASGNRFIHSAIRRQNQMRRLSNYDWTYGYERVVVNSREHLQMLATIEAGDLQLASALMRSHLQRAMQLRRPDGLD